MKIKNFIAAFILMALPFFTSCNNKEQEETPEYPAHLEGVWAYTNGSTGYSGVLVIEDIAGGQYAYFTLITPTQTQEYETDGSFVYDASTGKGSISSGLVGGSVSIVAYPSTDSEVDVVITALVSGGSKETFKGTFEKKSIIDIPTGEWAGTKVQDQDTLYIQMEIESIEPNDDSCGTLSMRKDTVTKTGTITDITSFVKMEENTALGFFVISDDEQKIDLPFAVTYNPISKDMTLTEAFEGLVDIELKSVNLN